jgi:predicted glutamine amidotransferase
VSRLVAYFGNDADRLDCGLFPARMALFARVSEHASGWGLGFVQGGDVLLQKRPRTESNEVDFFGLAKELKGADALIGRVGMDGEARTSAENADPFRFRWWLFGAVGETDGFDKVRERLLQSVPDFLRRNIRGRSASEHIFHLFLAFLHDAGLLETLSPQADAVHRAMRESITFVDRLLIAAGASRSQLAMVATNGRCLVSESHGYPLQYLQINGIADCTVCRDRDAGANDRRVSHDSLRAVIVEANRTTPSRPGWTAVPEGGALVAGADRLVRVVPPPALT